MAKLVEAPIAVQAIQSDNRGQPANLEVIDMETATYHLIIYSADNRWTGEYAIPGQRRLSDVINDPSATFLALTQARPAVWDNTSWRELPTIGSLITFKASIVALVEGPDSPAPPPIHEVERIRKVGNPVVVYAPPLMLKGLFHIPPSLRWPDLLNTIHWDFLPITDVSIEHLASGVEFERNRSLAMVNRHKIIAVQLRSRTGESEL